MRIDEIKYPFDIRGRIKPAIAVFKSIEQFENDPILPADAFQILRQTDGLLDRYGKISHPVLD